MHYTKNILLLLSFTHIYMHSTSGIERCIKKIKSCFDRHCIEKVDYKEYPAQMLRSLSIDNHKGSINIKTEWKKKHLCLKTIKRTKSKSHLDCMNIVIDTDKENHLSIHTQCTPHYTSGEVEYELIVPPHLSITLVTKKGNILVHDTSGMLKAITHQGNISITNTKNNVHAIADNNGTIYIDNTTGTIEATSQGNITVDRASNNITAHTKKGKINVYYKDLTTVNTVSLTTMSDNITLALPPDSSATINGSTAYGTLLCEHYITLSPCTTQLNAQAWNKFKKEIHGTLASGNTNISLSSLYGNIKIIESTS